MSAGETVVVIEAQAQLERRLAGRDFILNVGGLLFDRERLIVGERLAAVVRSKGASAGLNAPVVVGERGVGRVRDPEAEILVQLGRADGPADLEIVMSGQVAHVHLHPNSSASGPG